MANPAKIINGPKALSGRLRQATMSGEDEGERDPADQQHPECRLIELLVHRCQDQP